MPLLRRALATEEDDDHIEMLEESLARLEDPDFHAKEEAAAEADAASMAAAFAALAAKRNRRTDGRIDPDFESMRTKKQKFLATLFVVLLAIAILVGYITSI